MKDILFSRLKFCQFVSSHKSMEKFYFKAPAVLFIAITFALINFSTQTAYSQSAKQQAETQLKTMSPDQIDAKIKELGMTRAEAESKAKEYGIDLDSYLLKASAPTVVQPTPTIKIDVAPQTGPAAVPQTGTVTTPGVPVQTTAPVSSADQPVKIVPVKVEEPKPAPGEIENFGYSIFKSSSMFEARPSIDNDYRIGVGDVLKIALWGEMQSYNEYTVDGEGRILVSAVGPIMVSGLTLERARKNVQNAMSSAFGGLTKSPPTIFMDLTVARIRPVRIFMMGEVNSPGGFEVSGFANVFNSMFAVGGPKLSGSLRDVRVIRSGKTIGHVDMYDYLIGSAKTSDMRINDNDILYIPLKGKTVTIRGEVLRSARFELLPDEHLNQLIEFSGGIRSTFYLQRIHIDRIIPFAERKKGEPDRKVFDIDYSEILKSGKDYKLEDGDIVTIFSILDEKKNFVVLNGAVRMPGTYQLDKINTIKDLIATADGLLPDAYLERANLVRTYDDKHTEEFFVNINRVLRGDIAHNMKLEPRDDIRIFSLSEILTGTQTITVEGKAKLAGTYRLHDKLTLYDVIVDAVGLTDTLFRNDVLLESADLIRSNQDGFSKRIVPFNLWKLFTVKEGDTLLLPNDRVIIYPRTAIEERQRYVDIHGNIKKPGQYSLAENMTLVDLLLQAGGYTEDAYTVQAEIVRITRTGLGNDSLVHTYFVELPELLDNDAISAREIAAMRLKSTKLQHRDQIFVRPNPAFVYQQFITVEGEVQYPGRYILNKHGERISQVIKRTGGVKINGYLRGGKLIRDGNPIHTNIEKAVENDEGPEDIMLKPGDVINIPRKVGTVTITGNVNNPGTYGYAEGKSFNYYLKEAAGGKRDSTDYAVVTYPEGLSEKVGFGLFSGNPTIPDGSSIHVYKIPPPLPELPDTTGNKTTLFDVIKDTLAIVVSAVTIVVLANKL